MANNFVNTITTKDGTTYDVQDKRLTVTAEDAGKVVAVDSNGNLSLTTPSGGTKLYLHFITVSRTGGQDFIYLVNRRANAYTSLDEVRTDNPYGSATKWTDNSFIMGVANGYGRIIGTTEDMSYHTLAFVLSSNGTYSIYGKTLVSDTVTEL